MFLTKCYVYAYGNWVIGPTLTVMSRALRLIFEEWKKEKRRGNSVKDCISLYSTMTNLIDNTIRPTLTVMSRALRLSLYNAMTNLIDNTIRPTLTVMSRVLRRLSLMNEKKKRIRSPFSFLKNPNIAVLMTVFCNSGIYNQCLSIDYLISLLPKTKRKREILKYRKTVENTIEVIFHRGSHYHGNILFTRQGNLIHS
ncbi:hypothetical protein H8356DRAFT_1357005 [Neocallimastix lanati (nom. inval.)]|nr:hypothetical protein H8356DRAFT_1357005 [Neocallimastix sp. JGI-2020a]